MKPSSSSPPRKSRAAMRGCDYQGYEFGAGSYPDSVCINGSLHDADHCDSGGRVYLNEEDIPCPICRRREAIQWWAERINLSGTTRKDSWKCARSLVTDIRRNRGLTR